MSNFFSGLLGAFASQPQDNLLGYDPQESAARALTGNLLGAYNAVKTQPAPYSPQEFWRRANAGEAQDPRIYNNALAIAGIVSPMRAMEMTPKVSLPDSDLFQQAVANTPGASITNDGLLMNVTRNQRPEQSMSPSVRGGVFYLPQGSKNARYYNGTGPNYAYGGQENIAGETLLRNPLFVKGATGGKAPEAAFDLLNGKGAYQSMRSDALQNIASFLPKNDQQYLVERFLGQYAPELAGDANYILGNSAKGNQLAYALQEAAVASAARKAGYDSILGYSLSRKPSNPFLSELFDVRESHYPDRSGWFRTWGED